MEEPGPELRSFCVLTEVEVGEAGEREEGG